MSVLLPLAVAIPLVLALALLPRATRTAALALAPWAAAPALAAALVGSEAPVELRWLVFGTRFALDDVARVFLGFTAALWLAAGVYGAGYLANDERRTSYTAFFLVTMTGNLGLAVAQDLASFYVLFALMSFAAYGLVVHARSREARRAGRIYLALVVVGELLLFSGFVLLVAQSEAGLAALGPHRAPSEGWAFPLLLAGFGIKAGALPLHVWLPLAHPVAPTPASAVLSGAMIKAGLLGWLRFLPLGSADAAAWAAVCVAFGLAAAFYGALIGIAQRDAKTVLAYSSISQMGLITVALGAALVAPAAGPAAALPAVLAYAVHHGLAKGALFLGVGVAAGAHGPRARRGAIAGLGLAAAALAGLPATTGAAAKNTLKYGLDALPPVWAELTALLLPVAAVGTTLLMARFLVLVRAAWSSHEEDERHAAAGTSMWIAWLAVLVAVAAGPLYLPGWTHGFGGTVAVDSLFDAVWPIAAGVFIAWLALRPWRAFAARLPRPPAGDLLVPLEHAMRRVQVRWAAARAKRTAGPTAAARWQTATLAGSRLLERAETALTAGPVLGTLLLALVAALAFALIGR